MMLLALVHVPITSGPFCRLESQKARHQVLSQMQPRILRVCAARPVPLAGRATESAEARGDIDRGRAVPGSGFPSRMAGRVPHTPTGPPALRAISVGDERKLADDPTRRGRGSMATSPGAPDVATEEMVHLVSVEMDNVSAPISFIFTVNRRNREDGTSPICRQLCPLERID